MDFANIPDGVIAVVAASAAGGLLGGMTVGIKAGLGSSTLMGVIVGLSLSTVLQMLGVSPIFGVDGYSLVYGFVAGVVTAWLVAKGS